MAHHIEVIRSELDAFNRNDLDACAAALTEDFVINLAEVPEPLRGPDVWREGAELMKAAFPDLVAHIDDILADGDRVGLRLTFTGTHRGDFLGCPATGRTVRYVSHEFYRLEGDRLAEEWICSDMASLIRQISPGP